MKIKVKDGRSIAELAAEIKRLAEPMTVRQSLLVLDGHRIVPMTRRNAPFRDVEESTEWYKRPAYEPSFSEMERAHLDRAALGSHE